MGFSIMRTLCKIVPWTRIDIDLYVFSLTVISWQWLLLHTSGYYEIVQIGPFSTCAMYHECDHVGCQSILRAHSAGNGLLSTALTRLCIFVYCSHRRWQMLRSSNLCIRRTKFPKVKYFSSRLAVVFAQAIEARCLVENEDVIGAAIGDAPTTSEWWTILLRKLRFRLEVWR